MNIFISVRKSEKVLKAFFSGFLVFTLVMSQLALPFGVVYAQEAPTEPVVETEVLPPAEEEIVVDEEKKQEEDIQSTISIPTPPQEAQISITKIICPTEDLLPNWGSGAPDIDAGTAQAFLADNPSCYEQHGWMYEWAVDGTTNPGDNVQVGGGAWMPFDENNLPEIPAGQRAWVREQIPSGYIPFSGSTTDLDNETSKYSAEFYCNNDVLNYDNYDYIDPVVAGQLYHCVAFNVPVSQQEETQCNPEENLIQNGDFEAPALSNGTWSIIPDSNTLLKWLVAWAIPTPGSGLLGLEIQNNVAGAPAGGSQHAELDGDHPVTIWQDIPTIPGKEYSLSFKYSPRPGRDLADDSLQVKKDGVVLGANIATDGTANGNTVWQTINRTFVATDTTTKVEIFDNGTDTSFGGYVDDVDLRCIGNPVQKQDGFIHVYKFVDGEQATPENVDEVLFPMFNNRDVNTFTLGPTGWWGGNDQSPADIPYEATAWQAGGGIYFAWENLDTPLVGASCEEEKPYALEGYSSGATLEEAIANGANKTLETPSFVIDGNVNLIVWNKKCGDETPQTSTVTMCKVDSTEQALSGWTLMLKGENVEDLSVNSSSSLGTNTTNLLTAGASYIASVVGTWLNQGGVNPVDAEYSTTDSWTTAMDGYTGYQTDILELQIDNEFDPGSAWGAYNSLHKYAQSFVGSGVASNFRIFDGTGTTQNEGWFGDNSGSLDVNISKGFAGITDQNGCVVFKDVPYGSYSVDEIMKDGWSNVSGLGEVVVNDLTETFTIVNRDMSIPIDGKVHIFKFVDGVQATSESVAGVSFPMNTPTYGNAPFTLGADGWTEGDAPYEASTSTISAGGTYTANENLTTPLVGSSCEADNNPAYELEGYSTGATLELAKTATKSLTPPELTINGDIYMIVWNKKCGEVQGSHTIKVHVYKYLKEGDVASQIVNGAQGVPASFPMQSSWDAPNIGAGTAGYVLGNAHGGAAFDYAADTSPMEAPADYTTQEITDIEEGILPVGAQCSPERYRLVGYKSGDTLEEAEGAAILPDAPVYTDISIDKYIIVVNEECADVPPPPTCPATYTDNSDNSGAIRFESSQGYSTGSINGVNGWTATGAYDHGVVANTYGYPSFNDQTFRISDGITSGSFGDWVFATPNTNGAGEASSTEGAFSKGVLQNHFEAQFDIASVLPCQLQEGLHISVSPDRGDGSRMSYLRFEDTSSGLDIFFDDVLGTGPISFNETLIADNLERSIPHKIKFVMDFVDGPSNDVVKIYIDGVLVHTGTSWENYYRYDSEASAEQSPRIVKTLIFQARGTAHPANTGNGYLIDNLTLGSSMPAPLCSDGIDNDGDEETDYPADSGCTSAEDNDETTPQSIVPSDEGGGGGGGAGGFVLLPQTLAPQGQVLGESTSCGLYVDSYLKRGAKNNKEQVKKLQQFLNDYLKLDPKLPVNGNFGLQTYKAVVKFQEQESEYILKPWVGITLKSPKKGTGWVYKTTITRINNIMCPELNIPIPPLIID